VLIMIILGGIGHLRGALIGAFAFALLQEFFKSEAVFGASPSTGTWAWG
jgi:branched-chain amino acid transport system permease protein